MKEKKSELIFIIDKSGSMSGLEKDTIGGFNSLIRNQKKEKGQAIVSFSKPDIEPLLSIININSLFFSFI